MPRTLVPGLRSPHPVVETLPGMFQDDEFLVRFLGALDELAAPVFSLLDGGIEAMLDPRLVPADFLPWLASWLGVAMEEGWPEERRRELVRKTVELYQWRGTVEGLARAIEVFTGEVPEILESGGVSWSTRPGGDLPGVSTAQLVVRVDVAGDDPETLGRIERLVTLSKPAHLAHRVEAV